MNIKASSSATAPPNECPTFDGSIVSFHVYLGTVALLTVMTVDAPFAASRLLVVARILAAVFACSCTKPECARTLDGTPGKSVVSKAV